MRFRRLVPQATHDGRTVGEKGMGMVVPRGFTIPAWLAVALVACGDERMPPFACSNFPQQTITVGEGVVLEPCFEDPEFGALALAARSSNPEVATGEVLGDEVRIAGVSPGTAAITVTATDPDMLTAELAIEVLVPNRPPLLRVEIPSARLKPGAAVRLALSDHFFDPDGQELVYDAMSSDTLVASIVLSADTLAVTGMSAGEDIVTVMATDPDGLSVTAPIRVVVRVNRPPVVVKAIPPELVGTEQAIFRRLHSHFKDPDRDELVYDAMSSDTLVASVALSADTLAVTGVSAGQETVTVTATDPDGLSATAELDVRVIDNVLPFRDDFEQEASLDNWEVGEGTTADISDGVLVLTSSDGKLALVRRPILATHWTATARMGKVSEDSWVQLALWFSGPSRPADGYALLIGKGKWQLLENSGDEWQVAAGGESEAVDGAHHMVDVTLSHVGPEFSVAVGDTVLFSDTDIGSGSDYSVAYLTLAVVPQFNAKGAKTGVFDWVEVNGAAADWTEVEGVQPSLRESTRRGPLPRHGVDGLVEVGGISWPRMGRRLRRPTLRGDL